MYLCICNHTPATSADESVCIRPPDFEGFLDNKTIQNSEKGQAVSCERHTYVIYYIILFHITDIWWLNVCACVCIYYTYTYIHIICNISCQMYAVCRMLHEPACFFALESHGGWFSSMGTASGVRNPKSCGCLEWIKVVNIFVHLSIPLYI